MCLIVTKLPNNSIKKILTGSDSFHAFNIQGLDIEFVVRLRVVYIYIDRKIDMLLRGLYVHIRLPAACSSKAFHFQAIQNDCGLTSVKTHDNRRM